MFYEVDGGGHGLPRDPFKAVVVPRPIGWISTRSADGVPNLAPYSFFNAVADNPPMLAYGSSGRQPHQGLDDPPKDTLANVRATGVFAVNIATWDLREAMNASSAALPPEVDEFEAAGLTAAPCRVIDAPRVGESPVTLECRLHDIIDLPADDPTQPNVLVLGRVVAVHIAEDVLTDGRVDMARLRPIARLGYRQYAVIDDTFEMNRPAGGDRLIGM